MQTRKFCILCKSENIQELLPNDLLVASSLACMSEKHDAKWIPFNIHKCNECYCCQTKYLADLDVLYQASHIHPVGNIRSSMDKKFSSVIINNKNITNIVELGGGKGILADIILNSLPDMSYYIVDPCYIGDKTNKIIISDVVENIDISSFSNVNTLIMSHLFEHLYNPFDTLESLLSNNIKYVYICHPDFDSYMKSSSMTMNILYIEHTFVVDNESIVQFFAKHGYEKTHEILHENYCVIWEFTRTDNCTQLSQIHNCLCKNYIPLYLGVIQSKVFLVNYILNNPYYSNYKKYIWPCSIHSIMLFYYGLNYDLLDGMLDNSVNKIGTIVYGYDKMCFSLTEKLSSEKQTIIFLNGGCFNKELCIKANHNILVITL